MKQQPGFVSISYKGVDFICIRNPEDVNKEEYVEMLNSSSDNKLALVNQKTWTYLEGIVMAAYVKEQKSKPKE